MIFIYAKELHNYTAISSPSIVISAYYSQDHQMSCSPWELHK